MYILLPIVSMEKMAWYRLFTHAWALPDFLVVRITPYAIVQCTPVSGIRGRVNAEGTLEQGMSFALEIFKKSWIEQRVRSRILLLIQQKLLGVFLEINEVCAHARTVDTRPSFPPLQQPGYEANVLCVIIASIAV